MAKVDYRKVVQTALSEVGYQGTAKNSKFTQLLDSYRYYNGIKANECTWCAIFYDYCVFVNNNNDKAKTIEIVYENPNDNTGAGCTQKAAAYKAHGRWITDPSKATTGDQIFYKKSNGAIYHTGIIVDWDKTGFIVVEGSTTYNGKPHSVGKRHVDFHDSKIAGFGRPDWYRYEDENSNDSNPIGGITKLVVSTQVDPLRLRESPSLSAPVMCLMKKGTIVEFVSDCGEWYKVKYKSMIGYAYKDYLKKV